MRDPNARLAGNRYFIIQKVIVILVYAAVQSILDGYNSVRCRAGAEGLEHLLERRTGNKTRLVPDQFLSSYMAKRAKFSLERYGLESFASHFH